MKYTVSPYNSSDPWEELELQRKFDNSTYEEEVEIEVDVDDCEEDDYSDDDE